MYLESGTRDKDKDSQRRLQLRKFYFLIYFRLLIINLSSAGTGPPFARSPRSVVVCWSPKIFLVVDSPVDIEKPPKIYILYFP